MRCVLAIPFLLIFVFPLSASHAEPVVKQPFLDGGPPRFVLDKRGPSGVTHGFGFSPDSSLLYTAGVDKCVEVWQIQRDPAAESNELGQLRLLQIKSIPWEISRGYRGQILAMDSSQDHLAIGGYAARTTGDIILIDRKLGQVEQALPPSRMDDSSNGHQETIQDLSFSPDGQSLVSVSQDAEVRVWQAPRWDSVVLRKGFPEYFNRSLPVQFLDNQHVAVMGAQQIVIWDISQSGQFKYEILREVKNDGVSRDITAISKPANDQTWITADQSGLIQQWKGFMKPQLVRSIREQGATPADLSYTQDGHWLAVANLNQQPALEIWDLSQSPALLVGSFQATKLDDLSKCRFSPDGKYLATQHGQAGVFHLFDLEAAQDAGLENLLSDDNFRIDVDRQNQLFTEINFVAPAPESRQQRDYQMELKNGSGNTFTLDLTPLRFRRDLEQRDVQLVTNEQTSGNWTFHESFRSRKASENSLINLENRALGLKTSIVLDRRMQGLMSDSCWIPAPPEEQTQEPIAIAIGTVSNYGVFIYRLPTKVGEQAQLVRYFRDHSDDVLSLSCSHDGRILASSSRDQTLKFWNLSGIETSAPIQNLQWGAIFDVDQNRLQVTEVTEGGIADSRGLLPGDRIVRLESAAQKRYSSDVREMQKILQDQIAWEDLYVQWERGIETFERRITPAWEPIATLFVNANLHWVAYTSEGYFKSSAFEGDELVSYLVNRGPGQPPRLVKAAQLRLKYDRGGTGDRFFDLLLRERSTNGTFRLLREPTVSNAVEKLAEEIAKLPEMNILRPYVGEKFEPDAAIPAEVEILMSDKSGYELTDLVVDLDGIPLPSPDVAEKTVGRTRLKWNQIPPDHCSPISRFRVKAVRKDEDNTFDHRLFGEASVVFAPQIELNPAIRIHLILLACKDYTSSSEGYDPLLFPIIDAQSILKMFQQFSPHYQLGNVEFISRKSLNRNLQKADVDAAINRTQQAILKQADGDDSRRDVIIVFLGGHGDAIDNHFVFVTEDVVNKDNDLEKYGIPWSTFQSLRSIPAPTIFLLDACHSHNATHDETAVREFAHDADMSGFFVLSATSDQQELANESANLKHGFLTYIILKAASEADGINPQNNRYQGDVEWPEIVEYVNKQLPLISGNEQIPSFAASRDLESQMFTIPMFRPKGVLND